MRETRETHEMRLVATEPSGAEEWFCPMCQRRILMQWPPHYEVVVLERGDDTVAHAGGGPAPEDLRWLREIGINWDGDTAA
jgi:hypothetical protein